MVICLGVCSPATHSEFLRIRAKSQVSLYPRAEHIVGTPQMCAEEWIVTAATIHPAQSRHRAGSDPCLMPGLEPQNHFSEGLGFGRPAGQKDLEQGDLFLLRTKFKLFFPNELGETRLELFPNVHDGFELRAS